MSRAHIRSTYVSQRAMEMIVSVQFSFCVLRTRDSNGGLFSVVLPIPWQLMRLISVQKNKISTHGNIIGWSMAGWNSLAF